MSLLKKVTINVISCHFPVELRLQTEARPFEPQVDFDLRKALDVMPAGFEWQGVAGREADGAISPAGEFYARKVGPHNDD